MAARTWRPGVTPAAVLAVARREIGASESPPQSNRQKYGVAYGWDGVAWCAIFCWWVFRAAGASPLIPKTAGTETLRAWYRARNQWTTTTPRVGDLVLFKFGKDPGRTVDHVGIVEAVEPDGTLITIEGNTASGTSGDQRNGGVVARRRRTRANVVGFARPAYSATAERPSVPVVAEPSGGIDLSDIAEARIAAILKELTGSDKPGEFAGFPSWGGGTNEKLTAMGYLLRANVELRQAWLEVQRTRTDTQAQMSALAKQVGELVAEVRALRTGSAAPGHAPTSGQFTFTGTATTKT